MSKKKSKQEEFEQEEQEQKEREKREREKEKRKQKESGLKLHHYRFVKFMEYLEKHNAVIHILPEGASEDSSHRLKYDFEGDDNLNVKDILIQALKIDSDRARDYIKNEGDLKAAHAIGERYRGLGNFITSIKYYFENDTPIDEASELSDEENPFELAYSSFLPENFDKSNVEDLLANSRSNFITRQLPKLFEDRFRQEKRLDDNRTKRFMKLTYNGFPFKQSFQELEDELNGLLSKNDLGFDQYDVRRDSMLQRYLSMQSELPEPLFIPGYVDYFIPGGNLDRATHIRKHKDFLDDLLETPALSCENDLILYRYELIWTLIDKEVSVYDWEVEIQILLLIIYYEHTALISAVGDLANRLVYQTRFTVFGSDDGRVYKAQKNGLDTETLAMLLQNYEFKKGLDQAFAVYDHQILEQELPRYPEPGAVDLKSQDSIQQAIENLLFSYFENKLLEGYHVP